MNPEVTKIVKVIIKEDASRYAVSQPIYKEDYGLHLLLIEGIELPEAYAVDFSSSETHGTSVTMIGNADGVLIPKQFIDTGKDIFAFLYITGEDFGRTVYKFRIPNRFRPDRTNDEPEPEEQSVIDQAIAALNTAVEQTAADVEATAQNVEETDQNATRAEQARDRAEAASDSAANSADSAGRSAETAVQAAEDAEEDRKEADRYAGEAGISAERAEQAANTAGWVDFYVDADGYLHYVKADSVGLDFYVDSDGYLHVVMED